MRALALLLLFSVAIPACGQGFELDPAHAAASVLLRERLKDQDARTWKAVRDCPAGAVLLIDGEHDHTDRVLRGIGLRWKRCTSAGFMRTSLRGVRLIILDCPGNLDRHGTDRLAKWVRAGGWLLSTDWAVSTVNRAFGTIIGTGRRTRDEVVRITDPRGPVAADPLLHNVFPVGRSASWWLEDKSFPVRVVRRGGARVLIQSSEMQRRYGAGGLCFRFSAGRGTVVHIVSHTYLQRTLCRDPWEKRSVEDEAGNLNLPVKSPGYRRLARGGALKKVRAGELNAALSIQQFVVNVFIHASRSSVTWPPVIRPNPRPPIVRPTPRPPTEPGDRRILAKSTTMRDAPGGEATVRLNAGLGVVVTRRMRHWSHVRTPAGQTGWVLTSTLE